MVTLKNNVLIHPFFQILKNRLNLMKKERKKVQEIEKEDHVVEKEARVGNVPGAEKGIEGIF